MRLNKFSHFSQEIDIVAVIKKYFSPLVAPVVNVVHFIFTKFHVQFFERRMPYHQGMAFLLNKYLSSEICKRCFFNIIFPVKFFQSFMDSSDSSRPTRDIPP